VGHSEMPKSYPFCVGVASMMPCSWSSMPSPKMRGPAPHMPMIRHYQACAEACWTLMAQNKKQAGTETNTVCLWKQSIKAKQDQSENALCNMQRSVRHILGCCTRAYTAAGSSKLCCYYASSWKPIAARCLQCICCVHPDGHNQQ